MQMPWLKTVLLYNDMFQEEKSLILQTVHGLQLAATATSLLECTHSREWYTGQDNHMWKQLQGSGLNEHGIFLPFKYTIPLRINLNFKVEIQK